MTIDNLRSDVGVEPDNLEPVARGKPPANVPDRIHRHAELVGFQASGNVRMAACVDVRIHSQRDAGARTPLARKPIDTIELSF